MLEVTPALRAATVIKPWPARFLPHTPFPKQQAFLILPHLEAFYGGAAGPGKSDALLMAALQYVEYPDYHAIIFRRTFTDLALASALISRAHEWLAGTPARWHEQTKTWFFPSGATVAFGYLESENDKYRYQGAEFQYCVAKGTAIRMADGSLKAIELIKAGDLVQTLQGPKPVTKTHYVGMKPSVRITTPDGQSVVTSQVHRVLTTTGWADPLSLAIRSCAAGNTDAESQQWCQGASLRSACQGAVQRLARAIAGQTLLESHHSASGVWSVDDRSGYKESADARLITSLPETWSVEIMLHVPDPPPMVLDCVVPIQPYVRAHAGVLSLPPNLHSGCRHVDDSCGGQYQPPARDVVQSIQLPAGAAALRQTWCHAEENTRRHNRSDEFVYNHPYTNAPLVASEAVRPSPVQMALAGEAELFDLTVAGASHYITANGIVCQNCAFDELTQFTESQYTYLFSRLRRRADSTIPLRMRAASNPGGVGHTWVKERFVEPGNPNRPFIRALLADNPYVDRAEYVKSLSQLSPLELAQLLNGDWINVSGTTFKRQWFITEDTPPLDMNLVRFWDLAATDAQDAADPDWTCGALAGLDDHGILHVVDVRRIRSNPSDVELFIRKTAEEDGDHVDIYFEQEPGASGKSLIDQYRRRVLQGFGVYTLLASQRGSKVANASPLAGMAGSSNVRLLRAAWNRPFLDEAEAFPQGKHDDQVDAVASVYKVVVGSAFKAKANRNRVSSGTMAFIDKRTPDCLRCGKPLYFPLHLSAIMCPSCGAENRREAANGLAAIA